jgi:glucose-6-phosphate isomerase
VATWINESPKLEISDMSTAPSTPVTELAAWKALATHAQPMRDTRIADLFAKDAARGHRFTAEAAGIFLDYSKNRASEETLRLLLDLAREAGLRQKTRLHVPRRQNQHH